MKLTDLTETTPPVFVAHLPAGAFFLYEDALFMKCEADTFQHLDNHGILIAGGYFARKPGYIESFGPKCSCIQVEIDEISYTRQE